MPWRQLIADELALQPVVVLRDLVATHVRGDPSRAQLSAARRAANRYAATGLAAIVRIPADTAANKARLLTLVRTADSPTPIRPRRTQTRTDLDRARTVSAAADHLVPLARRIDPTMISVDDARDLATLLDAPIQELLRLRIALARRGATIEAPDPPTP